MTKLQQKKPQLYLCLFCSMIACYVHNYRPVLADELLTRVNGLLYDNLIRYFQHKSPQSVPVVVIDIDNESVEKEGRWPWPRSKLAMITNNLKKAGVVVTVFDIVMSQAEENYALGLKNALADLPPNDEPLIQRVVPLLDEVAKFVDNNQVLANAIKQSNVVLGYLFQEEPTLKLGMLPVPLRNEKGVVIDASKLTANQFGGYNGILKQLFDAAPEGGFVTSFNDPDGIHRHRMLVAKYDNKLYASLVLSAVMHYFLAKGIELQSHHRDGAQELTGINVGGLFVPTNRKGQVLIPYYGPPGSVDYYSASYVIDGHLAENQFAGGIAIVGSTMAMLSDLHRSPVYESYPGVEMNANVISGILSKQIVSEYDWHTWQGVIILVLMGLVPAIFFVFLGPFILVLVYLTLMLALCATSLLCFLHLKMYMDWSLIFSLLTIQFAIQFIYSFYDEHRQKNRIQNLFGQYVPPSYVQQLTDSSAAYSMQGESRNMTVFFADIRDFTSISESLDAMGVKQLLNTIFTPMTELIFKHQGTIDKYVGDMVVAFWGAPLEDAQHPKHAIEAALAIQKHLPTINELLHAINLPSIRLGMGLCSGLMNVGDMGSTFRRAYTVLGDTVNLASRLQDLTKFYQVNILTNEATRSNQEDFIWQLIDKVAVKGRKEVINIYEPLGYHQEATPALLDELKEYEKALNVYYQQDWVVAKDLFEGLCARYPQRYLYQLYVERVVQKMDAPKLSGWDGAFIHTHK